LIDRRVGGGVSRHEFFQNEVKMGTGGSNLILACS
jgi:hypothetical protein